MCQSMVNIQSPTAEIRRGKKENQLKFAGVPQTGQPISAASRPKFTILCEHVEDILLLNTFFTIVDSALVAKI